jgi:hypothetical protein
MKVAFLLSGQPRLYEEVFPTIKQKILDIYDCDVYAHAWWTDDMEKVNNTHLSPWSKQNKHNYKFDKDFPNKFISMYNPVKFLVEPPLFDDTTESKNNFIEMLKSTFPTGNGCEDLYSTESMLGTIHKFFSVDKVYNLVDWNNNYDWIVYWRYDQRPNVFPDLNKLEEKTLYAYTDPWCTFCNRETEPYPYNYNFIDTVFILHPTIKKLLDIKNFYFTECIKNNLMCTSDGWKYQAVPETVWALNAWFHNLKSIMLPNNIFCTSLIRKIDEYGNLLL